MSIPLSSGSFSSSSDSPAWPPPNSVLKVCWKLACTAVNASLKRAAVVSSIRAIASVVWAIDSTRSLRCVVRNTWRVSSSSNCSIAIMFTGPSRSIFSFSRTIASSAVIEPPSEGGCRARGGSASAPSTCIAPSPSSAFGVGIRLVVGQRSRIRNRLPGLLQFLHFRQHRVERQLQRVHAGLGHVAEVAGGLGLLHVQLPDRAARLVQGGARRADGGFLRVHRRPQRR